MATGFKMVFLPPQRAETRQWAEAVAQAVPDATIVVAENEEEALREVPDADAAFGNLSRNILAEANQLKWLAAPAIAPPAGYYYDEQGQLVWARRFPTPPVRILAGPGGTSVVQVAAERAGHGQSLQVYDRKGRRLWQRRVRGPLAVSERELLMLARHGAGYRVTAYSFERASDAR